jgi:Leucine-rich repeat (LRR) protein
VKILDMGLARFNMAEEDAGQTSTMTREGVVMGTPDYIAPEQSLDPHTVDIRADLYSLGCTLFFLLTGQPPFHKGSLGEKLLKHQLHEPPPLASLRPEAPAAVADVVARLLAKLPQDRYQTPAELAAALEEALQPAPPQVQTPGEAPRGTGSATESQVRRKWAAIAAAAAPAAPGATPSRAFVWISGALVSVFVVLVASLWLRRPDPPPIADEKPRPTVPKRPTPAAPPAPVDSEPRVKETVVTTPASPPSAPLPDEWFQKVRQLPPEEQVTAVLAKLKERNPGFNDSATSSRWEIAGGRVLKFKIYQPITDVAPVRALGNLQLLECRPNVTSNDPPVTLTLADLAPLRGLPLKSLQLGNQRVEDLTPLVGPALELLLAPNTRIRDLAPLKDASLRHIDLQGTPVVDFRALQGLPLANLTLANTALADLEPLAGIGLTRLDISGTAVRTLTPLSVGQLTDLHLACTQVSDLTPLVSARRLKILTLSGAPVQSLAPLQQLNLLQTIYLTYEPKTHAAQLRALPKLKTINGQDVGEFWKLAGPDPVQDQWLARVEILPAAAQIQELQRRLHELNPGYTAEASYFTDDAGAIVTLKLPAGPLRDVRPVAALKKLRQLEIGDTQGGAVRSLEPLRGLALRKLVVAGSQIADLAPLAGMPLEELSIFSSVLRDLGPLRGSKLHTLALPRARIVDLSPLAQLPLRSLDLSYSCPRDVTPLAGLRELKSVRLLFAEQHHRTVLRGLKLASINDKAPEVFWQQQADQQLEFIRRELMRLNPGFDGQLRATFEAGMLQELRTPTAQALDLRPVAAALDLKRLWCAYEAPRHRDLLRALAALQEVNGQPAAATLR